MSAASLRNGAGVVRRAGQRGGRAEGQITLLKRLSSAGVVETLRALADDVARLPDDRLDVVLPRVRRPLEALPAAVGGVPARRTRRRPPAGRRR
jgi:hypothetical protein